MQELHVRVRGGKPDDLSSLMHFYRTTETETLPPPSLEKLKSALQQGSLLIVENIVDGSILATGGYFEYIKSNDDHLIFELAGTRVTKNIGRLTPVPLQQILLALRFTQLLVTEDEKLSISVISSARHKKSIANLEELGMVEIKSMTEWLEYDIHSWTPMKERSSWRHFIASQASVEKSIEILDSVGFSVGQFNCTSERRLNDGATEQINISIEYDLPVQAIFAAMIQARNANAIECNFVSLPTHLP
jgi:hypothetical protein